MIPDSRLLKLTILSLFSLILVGCGGGSGGSSSSNGTVTGIVSINGVLKNNSPVSLMSVAMSTKIKITTTTNASGNFTFTGVVPGKYYVVYQEGVNEYTEPTNGELSPKDVYIGATTVFNIFYTFPPDPPEE